MYLPLLSNNKFKFFSMISSGGARRAGRAGCRSWLPSPDQTSTTFGIDTSRCCVFPAPHFRSTRKAAPAIAMAPTQPAMTHGVVASFGEFFFLLSPQSSGVACWQKVGWTEQKSRPSHGVWQKASDTRASMDTQIGAQSSATGAGAGSAQSSGVPNWQKAVFMPMEQ